MSPDRTEAAQGAMLGLALGDAYGRPLELLSGDLVRHMKVDTSALRWTDDTQLTLTIARAILDTAPGPLDADALGHAVGRRMVEWVHDPETPSLGPGGACLRGAAAYGEHGDWRRSGDPRSDGCGAVMRVLPVALAYGESEVAEAAQIQALVTHGHPNALETCSAAVWLVQHAIAEGRLDRAGVRQLLARLRSRARRPDEVIQALVDALEFAERPSAPWLDESIGHGDGGHRSASALGLAVAAVLVWGHDFATCIDRAARIEGDSDSVAALAGMLMGAAGGPRVLPADWLGGLRQRDDLLAMATSLVHWGELERRPDLSFEEADSGVLDLATQLVAGLHLAGARFVPDRTPGTGRTAIKVHRQDQEPCALLAQLAGLLELDVRVGSRFHTLLVPGALAPLGRDDDAPVPEGARTSQTDPIQVAWLPTPGLRGRIGLTFAPGKKTPSAFGQAWHRDLDADLERLAGLHQVRLLVPLIEDHELVTLQIEELQSRAEDFGMAVVRMPIVDGGVPSANAARALVGLALSVARAGHRVCFHCRGGLGRAGTLAALCLRELEVDAADAMRRVREVRPGAIENADQERFIQRWGRS